MRLALLGDREEAWLGVASPVAPAELRACPAEATQVASFEERSPVDSPGEQVGASAGIRASHLPQDNPAGSHCTDCNQQQEVGILLETRERRQLALTLRNRRTSHP